MAKPAAAISAEMQKCSTRLPVRSEETPMPHRIASDTDVRDHHDQAGLRGWNSPSP